MEELLMAFLRKSDNMRPGYMKSLNDPFSQWGKNYLKFVSPIPELISVVYSNVAGTPYNIKEQRFMDFFPGYLLIEITEYEKNFNELNSIIDKNEESKFFPLLRNYSSDFICVHKETGAIYDFSNHDGLHLIHNTEKSFLETLNLYYENAVFFLDDDGFLDYNIDKQYHVAAAHNPDVPFWIM